MMTPTVLSKFSSLLLAVYRSAQELPPQVFQDKILETVKPYLPFTSSMWGTATMTPVGIDIHSIHLHNSSQAMLDAYDRVKHKDTAAYRCTLQPTSTLGFNVDTDFPGEDMADYRQFLRDFGHHNFLITSDLNPISRFVHWVSLYRDDPGQLCTQQDTQILSHLGPHLMQALAINRLVHLDRLTGDTAREKWSVAIADLRGVLYHEDQRFGDLIRAEWDQPDPDRLPQQLLELLLASDQPVPGREVVVQRNIDQGLLFLKARQRHPVDNLSPREFTVARLLAGGLSQKQVAARLGRSPDTIRSQCRVIFDKLGINNVTMLAQHLVLRD
jgi:DNA-binding CsgD family transcriptional regulator